MKQLLSLLFLLTFSVSIAQTTTVNSEEYIMHKVKRKETLYGISKEYDVSIEELKKANPELKDGLKKGMELKVPKREDINEDENESVSNTTDKSPFIHLVKQGEGAFGIARKYGVSVEELVKANPGKTQDLKPGDELIIPGKVAVVNKNQNKQDSSRVVTHVIKPGETLYSLAKKYGSTVEEITEMNTELVAAGIKPGDELKVKTKAMLMKPFDVDVRETPVDINFTRINKINPLKNKLDNMVMKDAYQVSALLPFMFYKNDQIKQNRKPGEPLRIYQLTEMSTHFYQGMKLALDTLEKAGVSINLNVQDTRKDTGYVSKLLASQELKNSDLIIGPFYQNTFKQVTEFAKQNQVQVACPVEQSNKALFNNPYVTKLKASLPTQAAYLARYIAKNYNMENVVLVAGKTKKDKYLADLFEQVYNDSIKGKSNNFKGKVSRYNFTSYRDMGGLSTKLVGNKKNIVVFPSTDLGLSTSFFTQFNVLMNKPGMHDHEVAIYALENFKSYDNIDIGHKVKYNLHVTSSTYINYESDTVTDFIKKYRKQFGTEPNDFAFMGYDAMLYNGMALKNFGKTHANFYNYVKIPLLHTQYNLQRKDQQSGYENQEVYILSYSNYELNKVN